MKIGELETVGLLGKGAMSEVWEVNHLRLGVHYAIKLFDYAKDDDDVRARFQQEGNLLVKLCHPRIVGVNDVGVTDEGRPYFVMDLVRNPDGKPQTLADVPEGSVDEDTIARWYDDIRDGLSYIHDREIVHRDLKLQNIMVGPDGHAVLTDFGISRVNGSNEKGESFADPVKTILRIKGGERPVMGSLGYMAPEIELGCRATQASDWYALGIIVFKLLTGTWADARTDVRGMLESYDPAWQTIIPKLLHANPAGRKCLSFAATQRELRDAAVVALENRLDKARVRGRRARHAARWAFGACLFLSLGLLIGGLEYRGERRAWHQRAQQIGTRVCVPTVDELFAIPAAAKTEEVVDAHGRVKMPSRNQFSASRIDAIVLTHSLLSSLSTGSTTPEKVIQELERMAEGLEEDADSSPLDNLEFGDETYNQLGDNESLRMLLLNAAEKLRVQCDGE